MLTLYKLSCFSIELLKKILKLFQKQNATMMSNKKKDVAVVNANLKILTNEPKLKIMNTLYDSFI